MEDNGLESGNTQAKEIQGKLAALRQHAAEELHSVKFVRDWNHIPQLIASSSDLLEASRQKLIADGNVVVQSTGTPHGVPAI